MCYIICFVLIHFYFHDFVLNCCMVYKMYKSSSSCPSSKQKPNIGGVIVSVLDSGAVDREFEPRSGQTKDYKIGMCCFSAKHTVLRRKGKD